MMRPSCSVIEQNVEMQWEAEARRGGGGREVVALLDEGAGLIGAVLELVPGGTGNGVPVESQPLEFGAGRESWRGWRSRLAERGH
jgi:hypothetical protein